ncbi:Nodule Cysteine-Rich (NCR) secreted peptide [Medicago truncatula]|uniref:Nodule Cysteine-Rich (NCR) secreted peptide n=2 Tax=Medicago truncatula TaxID=3880 RepID=A0A072UJJ3_MEDTR|nr:Nodule Cysteine-Rich (NCR) secreted peptide [Medicago truncatula]
MAKIFIFVYALIIFLSQFLVITSRTSVPCNSDSDCPETTLRKLWKCVDGFCDVTVKEITKSCFICPKDVISMIRD